MSDLQTALRGIDSRANADPEFQLTARFCNATLRLEEGDSAHCLEIRDGRIAASCAADPEEMLWKGWDLVISAPAGDWKRFLEPTPAPFYNDLWGACFRHDFRVGGQIELFHQYYPALRRLFDLMRGADDAAAGKAAAQPAAGRAGRLDRAVGRYTYVEIDGTEYRVYFEEAGSGIPLLLQHTAGSDGRQWRHLLEDAELGSHFRLIAYDLPYHGKSLPPTGRAWWQEEYRLTRDFFMSVPVQLARALELERPVYMGSSIGGHLAADLACFHPESFRAVIGLEAALKTAGVYPDVWHHPRIGNQAKSSSMYGLMAPQSPEAHRRETVWCYSQGAPPVFKGDLYYWSVDHDLSEHAEGIDTSRCPVYLLTGEYDWATPPEMSEELAKRIPGAQYHTMRGLGHFPASENPEAFLAAIRPVLAEIHSAS